MILNLEEFEKWLHQQDEGSVVGITKHPCKCPMANYFRAKGYHGHISVSPGYSYLNGDICPMPEWAGLFVEHIDGIGAKGSAITAFTAAQVLYQIKTGGVDRVGSTQ